MAWLEPEKYADAAYQQLNSKMAIGSGMLWGKGLNNSQITSVKNGNFISEPQTDFIFAVVGEELGFIGIMVIVILLLLFIVLECISDRYEKQRILSGRLICCGMACIDWISGYLSISVLQPV